MPNRRLFLNAALTGAASLAINRRTFAADEPTWLTYAVNLETVWSRLPLLDRLKKVADAGFTHYEFWQFKTKDIHALDKVSRALNLTPVRFTAFRGLTDPKKKEAFLESIDDAIEVADTLGVKMLRVTAGDAVAGLERDAMIDAVVDALKEAADKLKDRGLTLLLGPPETPNDRGAKPLIATVKEAVEVIDAVGSGDVKILHDVDAWHADDIKSHFAKIGGFEITAPPMADLSRVLKLIHDLGFKDPIGLNLKPKADPIEGLRTLRAADAAAKGMG